MEKHGSIRQAIEDKTTLRRKDAICMRITKSGIQTQIQCLVRILLHGNICYANAPHCYVTVTLSLISRKAMAQFRHIDDSFVIYPHGQQRPRFSPRALCVGTVVIKLAVRQNFLLVRLASTVN